MPSVFKAANLDRPNTTLLAADPDLTFAMAANTAYPFELEAWITGRGDADFKVSFAGPAGALRVSMLWEWLVQDSTRFNGMLTAYPASPIILPLDQRAVLRLRGVLDNGPTAGSFQFLWAQSNRIPASTTVFRGSWITWDVVT